ncbi:MAG: ribonuclease III [Nitrospinae bacterium]|nr:ribonuclease III [Nitrospinota bacterium]
MDNTLSTKPGGGTDEALAKLQIAINYQFRDQSLLVKSLTHRSFANERQLKIKDNERLEFLGDSALDLIVSRYLFFQGQQLREGDLSKIRSQVVNEGSLARFARNVELGKCLLLGKGEDSTGGREKNSLLANAFEALIAAIYLDSSFDTTYHVTLGVIKAAIDEAAELKPEVDYKGLLQKQLKSVPAPPQYRVMEESGPDHDKMFKVQVWIANTPYGDGSGRTKKEAEQTAARKTCEMLAAAAPAEQPAAPADELP